MTRTATPSGCSPHAYTVGDIKIETSGPQGSILWDTGLQAMVQRGTVSMRVGGVLYTGIEVERITVRADGSLLLVANRRG